jgi:hypothetical protein
MKRMTMISGWKILALTALGGSYVWAEAPKDLPAQRIEAEYAARLESLKAAIAKAVPAPNERKKAEYLAACQTEADAESALTAAKAREAEIAKARGLVAHAKGKWIGGAEKGIAGAKAKLARATTDVERQAAREELAKWEKNRQDGIAALSERQAALDKAQRDAPGIEMERKRAEETLARAKARATSAVRDLGVSDFLSSDKLDATLATCVVMQEATPRGLAAFAARGPAEKQLLDRMFADGGLLVQMAVADGANGGNCGRAMEIYRDIQTVSRKATSSNLQRLALAIALEHAVPVQQRNAKSATNAPAIVDPVKRYLHYEKAFLGGELDPAFGNFSVWEYRMVVDGEEPDEISAWGREMLRNYRPDQIANLDYRWRYVDAVRTDIRYGSQDNQYDRDDLQFFQNILMNGGVCGRRAFYGRFLLRAFGIPTTARPQTGHAALVHWTPDGWVPCLGAGWGSGWTKTRYGRDLDFHASTQARVTGAPFLQVKRAQWIADALGERPVYGFLSGKSKPGFWYGISLRLQRAIIEAAKSQPHETGGAPDTAKTNETQEKIRIDQDGVITIPAAATSRPTRSTGKILFMESRLGGKQLHYSRNGAHQPFEYTLTLPAAGSYALTARVVTPSWKQSLQLTINDAPQPVEIPLPFTVGKWETTKSVGIKMAAGKNVLRFTRTGVVKGVTLKDFTLTPMTR